MCDFENYCIYYQDYAKRVRKNKLALERKYINKLKLEIERYKHKCINTLSEEFRNTLVKQLTNALKRKENEYKQKYGSDAYGLTAYILNLIRIYSIPFCF